MEMTRLELTISAAAVALVLTGCSGGKHAPMASTPPDDPVVASGSSDLRENSTQALEPPKSAKSAILDEEYGRRRNETARRLDPEHARMREALANGEWQTALDLAQSLEAQWASAGMERSYANERAEAHIGLGHPQEAILLIDPDPRHRGTTTNLTLMLALAMTDQLDAEGARAAADACARGFSDLPPGYPPTPVTRNQKIATVRTARALDAGGSAQDIVVLREAREALRLDPSQKLAAYVLADAAQHKELWAEAKANYLIASTLPGSTGQHARKLYENMSN